jgi:hypothetical protein
MPDITKQYSKLNRTVKKALAAAMKASEHPDEKRIFSAFKKRATADFRTLSTRSSDKKGA